MVRVFVTVNVCVMVGEFVAVKFGEFVGVADGVGEFVAVFADGVVSSTRIFVK